MLIELLKQCILPILFVTNDYATKAANIRVLVAFFKYLGPLKDFLIIPTLTVLKIKIRVVIDITKIT
jgi:hypothetical protein